VRCQVHSGCTQLLLEVRAEMTDLTNLAPIYTLPGASRGLGTDSVPSRVW
jgi:hypothetical protein